MFENKKTPEVGDMKKSHESDLLPLPSMAGGEICWSRRSAATAPCPSLGGVRLHQAEGALLIVRLAHVPDPVLIRVGLIRVRGPLAVVARVADTVFVSVLRSDGLPGILDARAAVFGVVDPIAVEVRVAGVTDLVLVEVFLTGVELDRAVVVSVWDAVPVLVPAPGEGQGQQNAEQQGERVLHSSVSIGHVPECGPGKQFRTGLKCLSAVARKTVYYREV